MDECSEVIEDSLLEKIVESAIFEKYKCNKMEMKLFNSGEDWAYCPKCSSICHGIRAIPLISCSACSYKFCLCCLQPAHPQSTCKEVIIFNYHITIGFAKNLF
jgi:hypothetical protein